MRDLQRFFANYWKQCNQNAPHFKCFLELQFLISRLQTFWTDRLILVHIENKFPMGVGVPDFRGGSWKIKKTGKMLSFPEFWRGIFHLSLKGKNTLHFTILTHNTPDLNIEPENKKTRFSILYVFLIEVW